MRKAFKYDYSEHIIDINKLCDASTKQIDELLYQAEAVQQDPSSLQMVERLIQ